MTNEVTVFIGKRELSDVDKMYEFLDQKLDDLLNLEIEDGSVEKVNIRFKPAIYESTLFLFS